MSELNLERKEFTIAIIPPPLITSYILSREVRLVDQARNVTNLKPRKVNAVVDGKTTPLTCGILLDERSTLDTLVDPNTGEVVTVFSDRCRGCNLNKVLEMVGTKYQYLPPELLVKA